MGNMPRIPRQKCGESAENRHRTVKSYDVIWSITSRHFYGTNMLFVRFWDNWISKGGQISHFNSIFMVRLWLEVGRLFQ